MTALSPEELKYTMTKLEEEMLQIANTIYRGYSEPDSIGSLDQKMIGLHNLLESYSFKRIQKYELEKEYVLKMENNNGEKQWTI